MVRREAVKALSRFGPEVAGPALESYLAREPLRRERRNAYTPGLRALHPLEEELVVDGEAPLPEQRELVLSWLTDERPGAVGQALEHLGLIHPPAGTSYEGDPLVDAALTALYSRSWLVRLRAIEVVQDLAACEAIGEVHLTAATRAAHPLVRRRAVGALAVLYGETPASREVLVTALTDEAEIVREQAARVLGWIGLYPEVVEGLVQAAMDGSVSVRRSALESLADLGPVDSAPLAPLLALLEDPDPGIRWRTAELLGSLVEPPEGTAAALAKSVDPDLEVRLVVITALGRVGGPQAVWRVAAHLGERDPGARTAAALALGRLGPAAREAAPALLEALRVETSTSVLLVLIDTLSRVGVPAREAGPIVLRLSLDPDRRVRQTARLALVRHGPLAASALAPSLLLDHPLRTEEQVALSVRTQPGSHQARVLLESQRLLDDDQRTHLRELTEQLQAGDLDALKAVLAATREGHHWSRAVSTSLLAAALGFSEYGQAEQVAAWTRLTELLEMPRASKSDSAHIAAGALGWFPDRERIVPALASAYSRTAEWDHVDHAHWTPDREYLFCRTLVRVARDQGASADELLAWLIDGTDLAYAYDSEEEPWLDVPREDRLPYYTARHAYFLANGLIEELGPAAASTAPALAARVRASPAPLREARVLAQLGQAGVAGLVELATDPGLTRERRLAVLQTLAEQPGPDLRPFAPALERVRGSEEVSLWAAVVLARARPTDPGPVARLLQGALAHEERTWRPACAALADLGAVARSATWDLMLAADALRAGLEQSPSQAGLERLRELELTLAAVGACYPQVVRRYLRQIDAEPNASVTLPSGELANPRIFLIAGGRRTVPLAVEALRHGWPAGRLANLDATAVTKRGSYEHGEDVREALQAVLEGVGPPATTRCCSVLFRDPTGWSFHTVSSDMWNWGLGPEAVPSLTPYLDSAVPEARARAAALLGGIGPSASLAKSRLRELLDDDENDLGDPWGAEEVREVVQRALSRIEERAVPAGIRVRVTVRGGQVVEGRVLPFYSLPPSLNIDQGGDPTLVDLNDVETLVILGR
jgi:HEAT repeat protein